MVNDRHLGPLRLSDWAAIVLVLIGIVGAFLAARSITAAGIGYDAVFEVDAALINRAIDSSLTLQQAYDIAPITSEFYGMLTFQLADGLHLILTNNSEWMPSSDPTTFQWQFAVTLGLSVIASIAFAIAVGLALRSRLAGAFAWAALMTFPLWLGLSVIDYKDAPVAAGLTLISAGLTIAWVRPPRWWTTLAAIMLTGFGGFIALGTRAGAFPLIAGLVGLTVVVWLLANRRNNMQRPLTPMLLAGASAVGIALVGVWLTNPIAHIDLPHWLIDSYEISKAYVWQGTIRTAGQDLPSHDLPRWYAPAWLGAQLPVLLGVAVLFGAVVVVLSVLRQTALAIPRTKLVALTPLVVQGVVLPFAIVALGSVLYDGIRHLMFMLPGLIAIAAVGVTAIQHWADGRRRTSGRRRLSFLVAPLLALLVAGTSLFATVRWFPYMYAFINPIAGLDKSDRNWELDYWGLTTREGVERLFAYGYDHVAVVPAPETGFPYGAQSQQDVDTEAPWPQKSGLYAFLRWDAQVPEQWCHVLFTIERDGQVLGQGGYCPK